MANSDISTVDLMDVALSGDNDARGELYERVEYQLRSIANSQRRRERNSLPLRTTELIDDSFMMLVEQNSTDWKSRTHFLSLASCMMRRILVDHARARTARKRGGGATRIDWETLDLHTLDRPDLVLDVNEAIEMLGGVFPRQARIVELRFFGGLSMQEIADACCCSKRTIEDNWRLAKAWLRRRFQAD